MRLTRPRTSPLRRLLAGGTLTLLTASGLVLTGPAGTASAEHGATEPGRRIVQYVVRPGDTATGLAVRYRAWTAELIAHNHLGPGAALRVGDRIEIPVVRSAADRTRGTTKKPSTKKPSAKKPSTKKSSARKVAPRKPRKQRTTRPRARRQGVLIPRPVARHQVRRVIARTARRHGVDPTLALAVAWQESGWQMDVVSSAKAIGAMQVLPATVEWMELYTGHPLNAHRVRGNARTGVELLRVLGEGTRTRRHQVAAYYQGLGAVREHGLYQETRPYVRNVLALQRRLQRGEPLG